MHPTCMRGVACSAKRRRSRLAARCMRRHATAVQRTWSICGAAAGEAASPRSSLAEIASMADRRVERSGSVRQLMVRCGGGGAAAGVAAGSATEGTPCVTVGGGQHSAVSTAAALPWLWTARQHGLGRLFRSHLHARQVGLQLRTAYACLLRRAGGRGRRLGGRRCRRGHCVAAGAAALLSPRGGRTPSWRMPGQDACVGRHAWDPERGHA
jgi:hypothetical protein